MQVLFLADEEVRQLTEAGCEICPMKWVDTDKNVHLRRDSDYASGLAKFQRQILQLVMWIPTISFAVGVHRLTSPFTRAISRTNTFKGKKLIEPCCIVFQLKVSKKKEMQAEKFWSRVFPSTVQRMQDEDYGFD